MGYEVIRIGHVQALAARLVAGERWDLVFNIAEGVGGARANRRCRPCSRRTTCRIRSPIRSPWRRRWTRRWRKQLVAAAGGQDAREFKLVVSRPRRACRLEKVTSLGQAAMAEGTGKGCGARIARTVRPDELPARWTKLLARYRQPVLVETYLPGREFTAVALLGTEN